MPTVHVCMQCGPFGEIMLALGINLCQATKFNLPTIKFPLTVALYTNKLLHYLSLSLSLSLSFSPTYLAYTLSIFKSY